MLSLCLKFVKEEKKEVLVVNFPLSFSLQKQKNNTKKLALSAEMSPVDVFQKNKKNNEEEKTFPSCVSCFFFSQYFPEVALLLFVYFSLSC